MLWSILIFILETFTVVFYTERIVYLIDAILKKHHNKGSDGN